MGYASYIVARTYTEKVGLIDWRIGKGKKRGKKERGKKKKKKKKRKKEKKRKKKKKNRPRLSHKTATMQEFVRKNGPSPLSSWELRKKKPESNVS